MNSLNKNKLFALAASLFLSLLFFESCSFDAVTRNEGFSIHKGENAFIDEIEKLKNPKGVIPYRVNYNSPEVLKKDSTSSYFEFFIFDERTSLIVLSVYPFYIIKIDSTDFYYHLNNELNQIIDGKTGNNKIVNTMPFYREVGAYSIEVYFSPKEIHFSGSGTNQYRIIDNNGASYLDLWRLIGAADRNVLYTPVYEEEKIHEDFTLGYISPIEIDADEYNPADPLHFIDDGKYYRYKRMHNIVYTNSSGFASGYQLISTCLNFTFFIGNDLEITDDILGTEDINFADTYKLSRDYAAFFSLPLGNSKDTAKDYLADTDGIAVIVRGYDLGRIKAFLSAEGIDL